MGVSQSVRFAFLGLSLPFLLGPRCSSEKKSPIEDIREEFQVPALGGLSSHRGEIRSEIVGLRKFSAAEPATLDDKFHLGSNTKAMTGTLIAIFIEEKKLRWDTDLESVFPDEAPSMNKALRKLTVEKLGAHMSGIDPDLARFRNGKLRAIAKDSRDSLPERRKKAMLAVLSEEPVSVPGSKYEYSNMNYIILGAILEKITGKPWEDLMRERLFQPLGMTSCGFGPPGDPNAQAADQPWGHERTPSGYLAFPPNEKADNPAALGPAGTVHCSMKDWAKFLQIHLDGFNGKDTPVLKAGSFQKLHTPYPGEEYTSGGWLRVERKWAEGPVLTHSGSNTLNVSVAWLAPRKDLFVLSVSNIGDADDATDKVVSRLLDLLNL